MKKTKKFSRHSIVSILAVAVAVVGLVGVVASARNAYAAQPTVDLQTAAPFVILAGTPAITDVGGSVITGNVGMSPASGAGTGLVCSQVTGTIYSVDAAGPLPCRITDGPLLVTAKNNLTAAFIDAAGRTPVSTVPTELGGTTKFAGVYDSGSTTFQITAGAGPLVIDGQGDPSSVFIFEMGFGGTGLTVGPGSTVSLINGASACNIFWRVDTATINTTAVFKGTIMALNSISVANGANIEGRLLARNGAVALNNDTIHIPTCATTTTTTTTSTGTTTPGLPNTGVSDKNQHDITVWYGVGAAGAVLAAISFYLARSKKQLR
jgi:hypothetical protein